MKNHLIFCDLETGGLNGRLLNGALGCDYCPIFEIAVIVTDTDLNEIATFSYFINHDDETINRSDEYALNMHEKSGLLNKVRMSPDKEMNSSLLEIEAVLLEDLQKAGVEKYNRKEKTGGIFCGSSVMFDRSFLMAQMPALHDYFHYRQIDVSSVALLSKFWQPEVEKLAVSQKKYKHEALADIRETINELRCYRDFIFRPNVQQSLINE